MEYAIHASVPLTYSASKPVMVEIHWTREATLLTPGSLVARRRSGRKRLSEASEGMVRKQMVRRDDRFGEAVNVKTGLVNAVGVICWLSVLFGRARVASTSTRK